MKITKLKLKKIIQEAAEEINLAPPSVPRGIGTTADPSSPFTRFHEIMRGTVPKTGLLDLAQACETGEGSCHGIDGFASDALFELMKTHDEYKASKRGNLPQDLLRALEILKAENYTAGAAALLKAGYEEFEKIFPHRLHALQENKLTKSKLKQIVQEELSAIREDDDSYWGKYEDEEYPPAPWDEPEPTIGTGDSLDELLTELFNVRTHAKGLEQYEAASHIDMAIDILETSISSRPEK